MTPQQIGLVQRTWYRLQPLRGPVGTLFYERLFVLDPRLKKLFHGGADAQGRKLVAMIDAAVASLDKLEALVPVVRELGERHATYGVKPCDYETVGAALLWALEKGLEEHFTLTVREAWSATYATLAGAMKEAAAASAA